MELELHTRTFYIGKETLGNAIKVKPKFSRHKSENNRFIFSFLTHCLKLPLPSGTHLDRMWGNTSRFTKGGDTGGLLDMGGKY